MNTKQNFRLWKDLYEAELSNSDLARATAAMAHGSAFGVAQSAKEAKARLERIMGGFGVNREAQIKERLRRINQQLGGGGMNAALSIAGAYLTVNFIQCAIYAFSQSAFEVGVIDVVASAICLNWTLIKMGLAK